MVECALCTSSRTISDSRKECVRVREYTFLFLMFKCSNASTYQGFVPFLSFLKSAQKGTKIYIKSELTRGRVLYPKPAKAGHTLREKEVGRETDREIGSELTGGRVL